MSDNNRSNQPSPAGGLDFLFSDIQYLKGVGPKKGDVFKQNNICSVFDLFYYVPRKYVDRSHITRINSLEEGTSVTILGTVTASGYQYVRRRQRIFKAIIADDSGEIEMVWFSGHQYMDKAFEAGDIICVSGTVRRYGGLNLTHPEFEIVGSVDDETIHTGRLIPIYPESASLKKMGLHSRGIRRIIKPALDRLKENPCETIPEKWRHEYGLYDLSRAIYSVHFPETIEKADSGRQRLAFEELFYLELILAGRKNNRRSKRDGLSIPPPKKLGRKLLNSLGFELTGAQKKVLREIYDDMQSGYQMNRLIQGDVGSGKTIVAVLAMLGAIEAGYQTAIMAPTEILAEQHYYSMRKLFDSVGIKSVLLTGSTKGKKRIEILAAINEGSIHVVIGTHAIIQKKMKFHNLGLAVIDEQHRFGVAQRGSLQAKGRNPEILVMSATPIPRTLAMTVYGDLDVSIIDEMPPGRVPVLTKHVPEDKRLEMYDFIRSSVKKGQSAYIIYPLVEETEKSDLKAAVESHKLLKKDIFPDLKIGLIHGRMKGEEKQNIMSEFREGKLDIIIATTVVEVGVDIPSATIMTVEHAERFGLSQLHQLRGRVGRAEQKSYCFLLTGAKVTDEAKQRIEALTDTTDGFKIAEIDLEMRGPGEILGTKQSGMPELRVASLTDSKLISLARQLAFDMVADDPKLAKKENSHIKTVLKRRMGKKISYSKIG